MTTVPQNRIAPPPGELTKDHFTSGRDVRWCPGCGDYSILAQMLKVLPTLGIPREKFVFVSGIGCSSRFPYYVNTYGVHSIHGRAPAVATGIKATNPDLSVWVITGDGDGLSIGGNHLMHVLRRNMDLNIILFNNRIYGLTKGQYSPTSEFGKVTKSSPMGTVAYPLNPVTFALSANATFVARSIDVDIKHLGAILERAARHKGTSFVEVYQNCNIFNDGAFKDFTDRKIRDDRVLYLEHGQPMIYGKEKNKGLKLVGWRPVEVDVTDDNTSDLLVHEEHSDNMFLAHMLAGLAFPEYPVPVGVFRCVEKPTFGEMLQNQVTQAKAKWGEGDLDKLFSEGDTWLVEED